MFWSTRFQSVFGFNLLSTFTLQLSSGSLPHLRVGSHLHHSASLAIHTRPVKSHPLHGGSSTRHALSSSSNNIFTTPACGKQIPTTQSPLPLLSVSAAETRCFQVCLQLTKMLSTNQSKSSKVTTCLPGLSQMG